MKRRLAVYGSTTACVLAIAACVGSDPLAGGVVEPHEDAATSEGGGGGGDSGGADDAEAAAPEVRYCALADRDGGPAEGGAPATLRWTANPPENAGTPIVVKSLVHLGCTIDVLALPITPPAQPPYASAVLHKHDAPGATCAEPKGFRVMGTTASNEASLNLQVAHHAFDQRQFVVGFSTKASLAGGSPFVGRLAQYDFTTGDEIHTAQPFVKGSTPGGPPLPTQYNELAINGCNLSVLATGSNFPGTSGTPGSGLARATYEGFLAPEPQPASPADSAMWTGG